MAMTLEEAKKALKSKDRARKLFKMRNPRVKKVRRKLTATQKIQRHKNAAAAHGMSVAEYDRKKAFAKIAYNRYFKRFAGSSKPGSLEYRAAKLRAREQIKTEYSEVFSMAEDKQSTISFCIQEGLV